MPVEADDAVALRHHNMQIVRDEQHAEAARRRAGARSARKAPLRRRSRRRAPARRAPAGWVAEAPAPSARAAARHLKAAKLLVVRRGCAPTSARPPRCRRGLRRCRGPGSARPSSGCGDRGRSAAAHSRCAVRAGDRAAVGLLEAEQQRTSVVLPAPLGPISVTISRAWMSRSTSETVAAVPRKTEPARRDERRRIDRRGGFHVPRAWCAQA